MSFIQTSSTHFTLFSTFHGQWNFSNTITMACHFRKSQWNSDEPSLTEEITKKLVWPSFQYQAHTSFHSLFSSLHVEWNTTTTVLLSYHPLWRCRLRKSPLQSWHICTFRGDYQETSLYLSYLLFKQVWAKFYYFDNTVKPTTVGALSI